MKKQYRIISASLMTALFVVGLAFGAMNQTNTTDVMKQKKTKKMQQKLQLKREISLLHQ